jgi:hypothetical protein
MPKTAVGLLKNEEELEQVVSEIEALGISRNGLRELKEPAEFDVTGVMSFPRVEYEVELGHTLAKMGATKSEVDDYIEGMRKGGSLVLVTDDDEQKLEAAAEIMNQHGARDVEESLRSPSRLPTTHRETTSPVREKRELTGRVRRSNGAAFFVW